MGRSYWYECSKCGYRAKVSGKADGGVHLHVQTILCRDCKQLYDAVIRLKVADLVALPLNNSVAGLNVSRLRNQPSRLISPPSFAGALNRLPFQKAPRYRWQTFRLQCPATAWHQVRSWNEPDACPKCGVLLEKCGLPFCIWD